MFRGIIHFVLFKTKENANYYCPEPLLCSFVAAQFETSLLVGEEKQRKCDVEHNLLKHNLRQKLNVIKDADIFSFMFGGFLHFKSTSMDGTLQKRATPTRKAHLRFLLK